MQVAHYAHFAAVAIWGSSTLMVLSLFMTAWYGTQLRKQNIYESALLQKHQRWAWRSFWITVATVLVIEAILRIFKLPHPWLFWYVHLPLLALYPSFLILALVFDGWTENMRKHSPRHPALHNKFGRAAQWFGLCVALTGDWLVFVLLWLPVWKK
jgi:hypothetical protein